jgi:hypothetical protein
MTKAERLELIRKIAHKYENVELEKKENPNEVPTEAIVLDASIPVSRQEIIETANEELDALREDRKDNETVSEALTADEK